MIYLDPGDHRPLYEQVKGKMKSLILKGALAENDRIPSVRELAAGLSLNPNTIQRAYKELETEGYLYSVQGKGAFVAPMNNRLRERHQSDLTQELLALLPDLWYAGLTCSQLQTLIKHFDEKKGQGHD
jgi:GntR family transcriptional regulator